MQDIRGKASFLNCNFGDMTSIASHEKEEEKEGKGIVGRWYLYHRGPRIIWPPVVCKNVSCQAGWYAKGFPY
jgi:hypothetical protein